MKQWNTRRPIFKMAAAMCSAILLLPCLVLSTEVLRNKQSLFVAKSYVTITPPTSSNVLLNPGKGWVLYGSPSDHDMSTIAYASTGYARYDWSSIEPTEGTYDWSSIDYTLNAWVKLGKQFAFGIMNADSSSTDTHYVTPQWVFTDGAAFVKSNTFDDITGKKGIQYIPVWNDAIFLQKLQDFLTALAARYDNDPNIAFIDIRSYGNYGEQHVYGIPPSQALSAAAVQKHIQMYKNAFPHVQLIVPWGMPAYNSIYDWSINNGVGIRRDGVMVDSDGSELTRAYGKEPGVFEFYGGYQWLVAHGEWSDITLRSDVSIGSPSYIGMGQWGNDAQVMLAREKALIRDLANRMGYYFILTTATIPTVIVNGQAMHISLSWSNQGVAYLYKSAKVALALLDNSNTVIQKQWLTGSDPRTWTPGQITIQNTTFTINGISSGMYKLAIGLFQNTGESNPVYKIGNQGRTANGWYVLSDSVTVL